MKFKLIKFNIDSINYLLIQLKRIEVMNEIENTNPEIKNSDKI